MSENKNEKVPIFIRFIASGVFAMFWMWRVLAGALTGAFVGGIIFLMLEQGYWAKVSFWALTIIGLVCGIFMAESARKRAKGSIPVLEHVYTSHDLDKK